MTIYNDRSLHADTCKTRGRHAQYSEIGKIYKHIKHQRKCILIKENTWLFIIIEVYTKTRVKQEEGMSANRTNIEKTGAVFDIFVCPA